MSSYYKTNGIILASRDVGEYDRIITCFTQDFGRVELRAKAVRKITSKLRGGLEPFSLSWLEFVDGKRGYIVTEAIEIKRFLKKGRIFYAAPSPVFEVRDFFLNIIYGQEKDEKLFNCLLAFFNGCGKKFEHTAELELWADQTKKIIAMLCGHGYGIGENMEIIVDS